MWLLKIFKADCDNTTNIVGAIRESPLQAFVHFLKPMVVIGYWLLHILDR